MKQTVVGLYDRMDDAQNVVRALKEAGFSGSDISLVAHDLEGQYGKTLVKVDEKHGGAAKGGATAGAVLGGIGGLLVGLGALVIPGVGPVIAAGPLAAGVTALVGAGAGAVAGGVAGGLLGALAGLGIPHDEAEFYAEGVRRGGALVSVTTDSAQVDHARQILAQYRPINIEERVAQWRQAGWTGYDQKAQPYTGDQISQDRARYGSSPMANRGQAATGTMENSSPRVYPTK